MLFLQKLNFIDNHYLIDFDTVLFISSGFKVKSFKTKKIKSNYKFYMFDNLFFSSLGKSSKAKNH